MADNPNAIGRAGPEESTFRPPAAKHLMTNPHWHDQAQHIAADRETVKNWFPPPLQGRFFEIWDQQLVVTVVLCVIVFAFWALLSLFQRVFLRVAGLLIAVYVLL